jgi:hypothetical protein
MRLHLEAAQRRMRELGLTQDAVDAALEQLARVGRAEEILRKALTVAALLVHRHEGWLARRRLRKALEAAPDALVEHLGRCEACGDWLAALHDAFIFDLLVRIDKTAPG